ncbi:MAG: SpoIIE family protein phosphatase [Patescibacteria group bacterium]
MFSLRSKLVLTLVLFVLLLLGSSTYVFFQEKQNDIAGSAFQEASSFSEVFSERLVSDFNDYFLKENALVFERNVSDFFAKYPALKSFFITDYQGKILYNSSARTTGDFLNDASFLAQIQSKMPSARTEDGRVIFVKKTAGLEPTFLDENEKITNGLQASEKISFYVFPVSDDRVLVYRLSYDTFSADVSRLRTRMIFLGIFGFLLSIGFAFFFAYRIGQPVQTLVNSASVIAGGDLKHRVDLHTGDEFEILGRAFNTMAEGVERTLNDTLYKERVSKELELAAQIQSDILPKTIPHFTELDIAGGLLPAQEVGGDFYDFVEAPQNRFLFYVSDVSGHSIPATVVASNARLLIRHLFQKTSIAETLSVTNVAIRPGMSVGTFLTLGALEWDANKKMLQYLNAGHQPLLQFHSAESKVTESTSTGIAIGMVPDVSRQLKPEILSFKSGDAFLLFTDGLSQAWKNEKENYGLARLKRAFSEYASLPSALAIRNALLSDVKEFTGSYKQVDDMTVIVIKIK